MKMESSNMSGGEDSQTTLTSLEWTDELNLALTQAVTGGGKFLLPIGINKHFHMMAINARFYKATGKRVESKVLWERFNELFDLRKTESLINCPFPTAQTDFCLPGDDFIQLIKDKERQYSQDEVMDTESLDSGGGGKSPAAKPIRKRRAAAVASSLAISSASKRKNSSAVPDSGSESETSRKSSSSTPSVRKQFFKIRGTIKVKRKFKVKDITKCKPTTKGRPIAKANPVIKVKRTTKAKHGTENGSRQTRYSTKANSSETTTEN